MHRSSLFAAAILILSMAVPAVAQESTAPPQTSDTAQIMALIRITSERLDRLEARADLDVAPSTGIARIDHAFIFEKTPGVWWLAIDGWAFTCDAPVPEFPFSRVRIVVDGIETDATVARPERKDVVRWNAESRYCAEHGGGFVPKTVGVQATLPLSVWQTDSARAVLVTIRVSDPWWGRAADSPSWWVTLPARQE